MFSTKLLTPSGPDGSHGTASLFAAVSAVAERSFFAVTEPCDDGRFKALAEAASGWLMASVQFEEGPVTGYVSCTLPDALALALFDALTGRGPADPAPASYEIADLIGEFSNMVCGAWLSRVGSGEVLVLSRPIVGPATPPARSDGRRLLMTVNDLPLAIDHSLRWLPTTGV